MSLDEKIPRSGGGRNGVNCPLIDGLEKVDLETSGISNNPDKL